MTTRRFRLEMALLFLVLAAVSTVPVRVIWSRGPWLAVIVWGVALAVVASGAVFAAVAYMGWRERRDEERRR